MSRIVVDPITRIEGHLRIEAQVEGGKVASAYSSATMWRGLEQILLKRDPREAWYFTQRICGVCTTVHALASVRAVEDALGITPPPNALLIRDLIAATQYVHDHVVHFYHLHALDWVDVTSALQADPVKASSIAQSISDYPKSGVKAMTAVKERLGAFVKGGRLGPFANGYWGHPAYRLSPEVNLIAVAHYLDALDFQRDYVKIHALLGGKNPHLQTYLVGGMSTAIDPASQSALNDSAMTQIRDLLQRGLDFVNQAYLPDLLAVASAYPEWTQIGGGLGNFLSFGDF
ncbi:MAG TPA: nickel-dependent hydrogenase large subunit, partial [Kineosporiaceae bacterium]|nr:nickel-dependent hydrogenase large subunit [Kineosporiaceae bacterium]